METRSERLRKLIAENESIMADADAAIATSKVIQQRIIARSTKELDDIVAKTRYAVLRRKKDNAFAADLRNMTLMVGVGIVAGMLKGDIRGTRNFAIGLAVWVAAAIFATFHYYYRGDRPIFINTTDGRCLEYKGGELPGTRDCRYFVQYYLRNILTLWTPIVFVIFFAQKLTK